MKTITKILMILGLPMLALAQLNTLTTTTLSSALTNSQTSFQVASGTGITGVSASGPGSFLYTEDGELMQVISVPTAGSGITLVNVMRGVSGTRATGHVTGLLVYIGNGDWFSGAPPGTTPRGTCTKGNLYVYPDIHVLDGTIFTCGANGLWGYGGPGGFHPGLGSTITQITGTYTVLPYDDLVSATSGSFTLTLPSAVAMPGKVLFLANPGAGTVTPSPVPAGCVLTTGLFCKIVSNGTAWIQF